RHRPPDGRPLGHERGDRADCLPPERRAPVSGKEIHEMRQFSEETAHVIDQEMQRFVHEASIRATEILTAHRDKLDQLAQALLEREALDREQMTEILGERATEGVEAVKVS